MTEAEPKRCPRCESLKRDEKPKCEHPEDQREGSNDYIHCRKCGSFWDYRKAPAPAEVDPVFIGGKCPTCGVNMNDVTSATAEGAEPRYDLLTDWRDLANKNLETAQRALKAEINSPVLKEREEFSQWYEENYRKIAATSSWVERAWVTWQAARADRAELLAYIDSVTGPTGGWLISPAQLKEKL